MIMNERFVSERLLNQAPLPLINFLWYLWDVYCDPDAVENMLLLKPGESGQCVIIPTVNKTVEKDFGSPIDAIIIIRTEHQKYYMSRL